MELSLQTITIIALSKLLLLTVFFIAIYLVIKKPKAWAFSLLASLSVAIFYMIIAKPLQTMWWGGNGDEMFIVAFLTQVLSGDIFADFYYHGLPPFYPPLYFWVTGLLAKPFTSNAISAAKLGSTLTFFFWFIGTYLWLALYHRFVTPIKNFAGKQWFWFLTPFILFSLIDFNDIILKPYETLPALMMVLFIGLFAQAIQEKTWNKKHYLFFGISGGLMFLTYYFWWFMAIPTLFTLALISNEKKKNSLRVIFMGIVMFIIASPYLIPLFLSYAGGIENWQALYFVPHDFSTFLPFIQFSWRLPLIIAGIIGLIAFHKKPFVKANIILLLFGFAYQFTSIILFLNGGNAIQAAKPFLFLGTASIAVGCSYSLIWLWENKIVADKKKLIAFGLLIFSLPFWPMTTFIDDPVVRTQIEKDLQHTTAFYLSKDIENNISDYQNKTWLSSGIPSINAYLPLHYFIAHNPHFSHHASKYSERLAVINQLADANTSKEFTTKIESSDIDALLLYNDQDKDYYPLFFWQDNYPNGGKELQINISKEFVGELGWEKVINEGNWIVYIK